MTLNVPLKGDVCKSIHLSLYGTSKEVRGWHAIRDDYDVKGVGMGNEAFNFLFDKIQREKTQTALPYPDWDKLLVIRVTLSLPHDLYDDTMTREQNFDRIRPNADPQRKADVLAYADNGMDGWELPLFISGKVFDQPEAAYMLDGARRITATALLQAKTMPVYLAITREELPQWLNPDNLADIQSQAAAVPWFPMYQDIPEFAIKGQRTRHKLSLFDLSVVKGKSIADFGCNIGQACLEYYYMGASKVVGFDCQETAITTGLLMGRELTGKFNNSELSFHYCNFNDQTFYRQINNFCPGMFDYSSFFAVYRTKELTQSDALFQYIIDKTRYQIFFEGHADPEIDTMEYYNALFAKFKLKSKFVGHSENNVRPCFVLERNDG